MFTPPPELAGQICYGGLDLASTTDIAALELVFPIERVWPVLSFFWVPKENAERRSKRDRVPYPLWIDQGFIEATDGNVIDYDVIRRRVNELGKTYQIKELAVDRWNSLQLQTQLAGDGFTVCQFGQGFKDMSDPMKQLMGKVLERRICHFGNPVLRWMASNVAAEQDAAGNFKPNKAKSSERIDGIVALIMAIGRAMVAPEKKGSVYDTRGLFQF